MKHLYFTRHGESLINTLDVWADTETSNNLGLTELGKQQALDGATRAKKAGLKPDLIICSPLERARETAAFYAETLGYPFENIEYNALFVEIDVGELEGTPYSEFIKKYTYADLGKFKGAETIEMLQKRAERALMYVKKRPETTILIVSHSCFGRAFIRVIEGRPYTDEFESGKNSPLPYATATKLI